ncbi:MAG: hypothetical protein IPN95_23240 [Bacteroidetes bacterium]|nr:hypothetical protein [Bacteroidota bacterium]
MCLVDFESGAFFSGTAIFLHEWVGSAIESGKMVEKQGLSSAIYFARRKSAKLNRADSECASTRKRNGTQLDSQGCPCRLLPAL